MSRSPFTCNSPLGSSFNGAMRMPLPKGLLQVKGERLIERLIGQLHAVDVSDIFIVTGFMKEKYEYLSNIPGVELIYNPEYARKNNLHSLLLAAEHLQNAYILPADIWFYENPFSTEELYSWYMLSTARSFSSEAALNRKQELIPAADDVEGYGMVGVAYLCGNAAQAVAELTRARCKKRRCQQEFWENLLLYPPNVTVYGRLINKAAYCEVDTFEDLRSLDYSADQLSSLALDTIHQVLNMPVEDIADVEIMKKGMTNRSFLFTDKMGKRYIMRMPGEGSQMMINRAQEHNVYQTILPMGLGDPVVYICAETGFKITEFLEDARVCDPLCPSDVAACMEVLRAFHKLELTVPHGFDLFERIDYYESLWHGAPSVFEDYQQVKARVLELQEYVDAQPKAHCLTHIDAVPDNFLFTSGSIRLIDWEYAAMQDPHVDIAMFAVYSLYDRAHEEALIDSYFSTGCPPAVRAKIYCYIAICGLLWSNWCEYKRALGVEFGDYALGQYRFAKRYYAIAKEAMAQATGEHAQ